MVFVGRSGSVLLNLIRVPWCLFSAANDDGITNTAVSSSAGHIRPWLTSGKNAVAGRETLVMNEAVSDAC